MIRRRVRGGVGMALAAIALSACASASQAGSAVVWDSGRITEDQLAEQVAIITAVDNVEVSPQITNEVVNFLTQQVLVSEAADRLGVSVTAGAVERAVAASIEGNGGEDEIAARLAANSEFGFEDFSEVINSLVRRDLLLEAMGQKLSPESTGLGLSQEVLSYLSETSTEINLTTNPRFGVWDPVNLVAQPDPDQLSRPGDNEVGLLPEGLVPPEGN